MDFSLSSAVLGILNFSASNYAWYVEMYIGLYILIPFLNISYSNLSTKHEKQILVFSFIIVAALPSLTNIQYKIIPSWWVVIYPIMYYFIGCYLKEFGLKIGLLKNAIFFIVLAVLLGTINYYISYGKCFVSGMWSEYCSFLTVCLTVLLFTFFLNINFKNVPNCFQKFLQYLSDWCFGGYLVSFIFDMIFYPMLNSAIPDVQLRFKYYFIIVPIVFIGSLCLSAVINTLYTALGRIYSRIR